MLLQLLPVLPRHDSRGAWTAATKTDWGGGGGRSWRGHLCRSVATGHFWRCHLLQSWQQMERVEWTVAWMLLQLLSGLTGRGPRGVWQANAATDSQRALRGLLVPVGSIKILLLWTGIAKFPVTRVMSREVSDQPAGTSTWRRCARSASRCIPCLLVIYRSVSHLPLFWSPCQSTIYFVLYVWVTVTFLSLVLLPVHYLFHTLCPCDT